MTTKPLDAPEQKELLDMNNVELYRHGTAQETVTPLENELLHRLEGYIEIHGDWLTKWL